MSTRATLDTNKGTLVAELYEAEAPRTLANFEKLANSGYYDGVKFHRVIPGFVVQRAATRTPRAASTPGVP